MPCGIKLTTFSVASYGNGLNKTSVNPRLLFQKWISPQEAENQMTDKPALHRILLISSSKPHP